MQSRDTVKFRRFALPVCIALSMCTLLVARARDTTGSGKAMTVAAEAFLESLNPRQREQASFDFDDAERWNWHFIPRQRKGVPLGDLEGAPLRTAQQLLASGLSKAGYDQALNVMSLEELLYLLESGDRVERRARRDPRKYYFSIFGKPSDSRTWGWRCEGHHLSLNYVIADGRVVSTTPEFFGANPGSVDAGPGRQIRVLGPEEDLARQILKHCSDDQKAIAWIDKQAPADLRGGGAAQPDTTAPAGLKFSDMSDDQKRLLRELLSEYLKNMPVEVTAERQERINRSGVENIHFAWWGGPDLNQPHYYRVQGPSFLIEYNNTQNSANHVHSIWRNMSGDFGIPLVNR